MGEISNAHHDALQKLQHIVSELELIPGLFNEAALSANGDAEQLRHASRDGVTALRTAASIAVNGIMASAALLRDEAHSPEPDTIPPPESMA